MALFNIFKWNWNAAAGGEDEYFPWDELPALVHLKILENLDRRSLNILRQISWKTRELIEDVYGIHVIIPERNFRWTSRGLFFPFPLNSPKLTITDGMITHLINQMEGKVIRTLDISEVPTSFNLEKSVKFPGRLNNVKMKYCDVSLVIEVLSKYKSLENFEYRSGTWRPLPRGPVALLTIFTSFKAVPVPAVGGNLWRKINEFPQQPVIQPRNLRVLTLVIDQMSHAFHSDWGTVIYIMLALPGVVMQSIEVFQFSFMPNMMLNWRIHLMIVSCVGEVLRKMTNLKVFRYKSTFNTGWADDMIMFQDWNEMILNLIRRFGSADLQEIGNATVRQPPLDRVMVSVRTLMNSAGRLMGKLRELSLKVEETREHDLWSGFIGRLPGDTVKRCEIEDRSRWREEPNGERRNVYKVLCLPNNQGGRTRGDFEVYGCLTCLFVHCTRTRMQGVCLRRILRGLPKLREVELVQGAEWIKRFGFGLIANEVDLEVDEEKGIFGKLEKLTLRNLSLVCRPNPGSVLGRFKSLRELRVVTEEEVLGGYIFVNGIGVGEMVGCLVGMRKLEKVEVKPLLGGIANGVGGGDQGVEETLRSVGTFDRVMMVEGQQVMNLARRNAFDFSF